MISVIGISPQNLLLRAKHYRLRDKETCVGVAKCHPNKLSDSIYLSGAHAERKKKLDCVWVTVNYFSRLARRTIILAIAVFLHLHSTVLQFY